MKKLISALLALVLLLSCAGTALGETKNRKDDGTATAITGKSIKDIVTVDIPRAGGELKNGNSVKLFAGQTLKLKTGSKKAVKWTSSDKSVIAIADGNRAVAKKAGKVTLTGTAGSEKYEATLVVNRVLSSNKTTVNLKVKEKSYVTFTFAQDGKLAFTVKDSTVVKPVWADTWRDGTIKLYLTGLKNGTTIVTVTNTYNSESIRLKVVVGTGKADPDPGPSGPTKYRALLVGNSNYSTNALPDHKWNVNALKGMLTKSLKTGYTVTAKYNLTGSGILSAIKTAFKGAKSNDVSLFYYGGHGQQYDGALCGVDGSRVYPSQLRDALKAIPGKVIVILDCCHSGSMITPNGEEINDDTDHSADFNKAIVNAFSGCQILFEETGDDIENTGELRQSKFIVLTACKKYEESWNWWYYGSSASQSFGTFTKCLFNGMGLNWSAGTIKTKTAPCDKNKNRIITVAEAYSYVRANATKLNKSMGGNNVQNCMYYGDKNYALFRLK